jgi:hypothetical protein
MGQSLSGSSKLKHFRPTINSYMVGNARAIASLAAMASKPSLAKEFERKAATLGMLIQEQLWDDKAKFFKVRLESGELSDAREAIGFVPWMFDVPFFQRHYESFAPFNKAAGFSAPYGITTAERAHPRFRSRGVGTCAWDGAVWPFATCQTLYALANCLRQADGGDPGNWVPFPASLSSFGDRKGVAAFSNIPVCGGDYFSAFLTYVKSQHADGKPYIGEYLDEVSGQWINRNHCSAFYNHSTFADLLITGIIGLQPRQGDELFLFPLLPPDTWDWFCLSGVRYHDRVLTICWDKDGTRYGGGQGLAVFADGKELMRRKELYRSEVKL